MRPWDWVVLGTLIVLVAILMMACVSVNVIPTALPLPEAPALTFKSCPPDICLSEPDANNLRKYLDQLNAFRHAWERLRDQ